MLAVYVAAYDWASAGAGLVGTGSAGAGDPGLEPSRPGVGTGDRNRGSRNTRHISSRTSGTGGGTDLSASTTSSITVPRKLALARISAWTNSPSDCNSIRSKTDRR